MEIECPSCGFLQDVPDEKIPPKAKMATCPKCKHKFNFRADSETREEDFTFKEEPAAEAEAEERSAPSEVPSEQEASSEQKEDLWKELESLTEEGNETQGGFSAAPRGGSFRRRSAIPWENLEEYGFFPGLFETIKQVMTAPVDFFRNMNTQSGLNKPLIFYLLIAEIQALAQFFWQMSGLFPKMGGETESMLGLGMLGAGSIFILVLYPVFLSIMLFIASGLNQLCLLAVQAGEKGYQGTFRVMSYASAPLIIAVVPVVGPLVGAVWNFVCMFIGLMYVHRASAGQVLLALLLPLIVILLVLALFALVGVILG
ncbi:MAG: YIP1 family protein [Thermodesulfobacteriota bacterium]